MTGFPSPQACWFLCIALVHFLWQGFLLAGLVWTGNKLLDRRSTNLRYALGLFALALMVTLPIGNFVWLIGNVEAPPEVQQASVAWFQTLPLKEVSETSTVAVFDGELKQSRPAVLAPIDAARFDSGKVAANSARIRILGWPQWLAAIYLAGVVVMMVRLLARFGSTGDAAFGYSPTPA